MKTIARLAAYLAALALLLASAAAGSYIRATAAAQRVLASECALGDAPVERRAALARRGGLGWTISFRRADGGGGEWARVHLSPGGTVRSTEPARLRAWPGCGAKRGG